MRRANRKIGAEPSREIALVVTLAVGLALFHTGEPLTQIAGGLLTLAGGIPLTARAGRLLRRWQRDRESDFAAVQQRERKKRRRERNTVQQERTRQKRQTALHAATRQAQGEAQRRQAERERDAVEADKRARIAQEIEAEAQKWKSLLEAERQDFVTARLKERGLEPLPEAVGGAALPFAGNGQAALWLPAGSKAQPSDLTRLEALRVEFLADAGWLLTADGFSPEIVPALRDYPALAFADPYILAHWKIQADNKS